ncbi:MAG TPA: helix-turn-helix transcriptional regulator [Chloroflexota bacterium]|jgi:DNA-binding Xre family transcriptional regulator
MVVARRRRSRAGRGRQAIGERQPGDELRWALADWLRYRRLSGRELARRAGLGRATVQRLASQRAHRVGLRTLAALCRALDLAPADLIVWGNQDPLPPGARARSLQLHLPGRGWR